MKTIKTNCLTTKISLKKVVMLLFFVAAFTTGAFAQNSCLVQGYTGVVNPPSPVIPGPYPASVILCKSTRCKSCYKEK